MKHDRALAKLFNTIRSANVNPEIAARQKGESEPCPVATKGQMHFGGCAPEADTEGWKPDGSATLPTQYECYGCGHWKPSDQLEDRTIYDQGDITEVLVCTRCLSLGWDNWGRP